MYVFFCTTLCYLFVSFYIISVPTDFLVKVHVQELICVSLTVLSQ